MNILGLHFGHDGAVAVLCDGVLKTVLLTERFVRVKHAVGLDSAMILRALEEAGVALEAVDYCAVSTTQTVPLIFSRKDDLSLVRGLTPAHAAIPSPIMDSPAANGPIWISEQTFDSMFRTWAGRRAITEAAQQLAIYRDTLGELVAIVPPENVIVPPVWQQVWPDMGHLAGLARLDLEPALAAADTRLLFHVPVTVKLKGRDIPGIFIDHHAAHAADVYYQSGLRSAVILSHDGAASVRSAALACAARDNVIVPVMRPSMWLGGFYNTVAAAVGLDHDAGKLMGLAPYGTPRFFDPAFVATADDMSIPSSLEIGRRWIEIAKVKAASLGYDMSALGNRARILEPINVDIAASAHRTFEDNVLAMLQPLATAARKAGVDEGICLAGGCALSCPTNTRVAQEIPGPRVFVAPSCDDTGLAGGAALWLYHNILGAPLRSASAPMAPYLGPEIHNNRITDALSTAARQIVVEDLGQDAPAAAAADLAADRVVAWFEGRSEIGPRALGHRSLLADPRQKANWARVNKIKGREGWRPFAPAVLAEQAAAHFGAMPLPSPYMLFTGDVRDPAALPAITHVDGTARVQTVGPEVGGFHKLLTAFAGLTSCPMVLNTSLNGPGEPIVETPDEALKFFLRSGCDVLYLQGHRVTKAS